jgi:hypothetical protein
MPLLRVPEPFDDPAWIFELKFDGFRALAFIEDGACRLVSRKGHTLRFPALTDALARDLKVRDAILDGEIVCLDAQGRSQFNRLLLRRGTPVFAAFDPFETDWRRETSDWRGCVLLFASGLGVDLNLRLPGDWRWLLDTSLVSTALILALLMHLQRSA